MTHEKRLSPKQRKAIAALLECATIEESAAVAGVGRRSIYRWLDDSHFRAELSKAEGQVLDAAVRRLVALSGRALDVLEEIIEDPSERANQRRLAAVAVLDTMSKLRQLATIESRLAALEERLL